MDLPIPVNLHITPFRKSIDSRDTHTVQAAGYFIAPTTKFTACVEHGHHHFQGRLLDLWVHIDRDATSVITYGDAAIRVNIYLNAIAGACQRLIDRVVNHLVDEMVKRFDVCAAHIHSGSASNGLQAFQYLDVFRLV